MSLPRAFVLVVLAFAAVTPSTATERSAKPHHRPPVHAVPAVEASVVFVPFPGVPGNTSDEILEKLEREARLAGIPVVPRLDMPATFRVEGRLSAVATDTLTTLFYDLRVIDAGGREVHRIVGQEIGGGSRGDPWGAVDDAMIAFMAKRAVVQIRAFLTRA